MSLLPWQLADWQRFAAQFSRLPHALLLTGPAGIGKGAFARHVAQALLCEHPQPDQRPCGQCEACHWFAQQAHPDFRGLRPDSEEASEGKSAARKLEVIKIEAVRGVIDFAYLSSHRGGRRVILIEPAEAMNLNAANALLKVLEEPPGDVVFLLVSHALQKLLPTLRSRCRIFPLTAPDQAQALAWLNSHGETDAATELAHAGGAPFALDDAALRPLRRKLLAALSQPGMTAILDAAGALDSAKLPLAVPVGWVQRWLHDLAGLRLAGLIRYYPDERAALNALAPRLDPCRLHGFNETLMQLSRFGHHTLNVRMQMEQLLLEYQALFAAA